MFRLSQLQRLQYLGRSNATSMVVGRYGAAMSDDHQYWEWVRDQDKASTIPNQPNLRTFSKSGKSSEKEPFFKPKRPYGYEYKYKEVDPNKSMIE